MKSGWVVIRTIEHWNKYIEANGSMLGTNTPKEFPALVVKYEDDNTVVHIPVPIRDIVAELSIPNDVRLKSLES